MTADAVEVEGGFRPAVWVGGSLYLFLVIVPTKEEAKQIAEQIMRFADDRAKREVSTL